jgi:hypothetical protein
MPGGNGLVLDAVSRLGVVEGGDGFVYRKYRRRDRGNDNGLAATAERFLEEARQLGVSVRNSSRRALAQSTGEKEPSELGKTV